MCLDIWYLCLIFAKIADKDKRYKDDSKFKNGLSHFKYERGAAGGAIGGSNGNTLGGTAADSDATVHTNGQKKQAITILRQNKVGYGVWLEFGDILIAPMSKSNHDFKSRYIVGVDKLNLEWVAMIVRHWYTSFTWCTKWTVCKKNENMRWIMMNKLAPVTNSSGVSKHQSAAQKNETTHTTCTTGGD